MNPDANTVGAAIHVIPLEARRGGGARFRVRGLFEGAEISAVTATLTELPAAMQQVGWAIAQRLMGGIEGHLRQALARHITEG